MFEVGTGAEDFVVWLMMAWLRLAAFRMWEEGGAPEKVCGGTPLRDSEGRQPGRLSYFNGGQVCSVLDRMIGVE
jgi:hypothetical protein